MILYLVRHGDAEPKKPGVSDFERQLTLNGRDVTQKMAKALRKMGIKIDLVVSSPLVRAVQTAEIIRDIIGVETEILKLNELIPGSGFTSFLGIISNLDAENILAVGHEPYLGEFLGWFICLSKPIEFEKNSIACVEVERFSQCGGNLKWFVNPEQILKLIE